MYKALTIKREINDELQELLSKMNEKCVEKLMNVFNTTLLKNNGDDICKYLTKFILHNNCKTKSKISELEIILIFLEYEKIMNMDQISDPESFYNSKSNVYMDDLIKSFFKKDEIRMWDFRHELKGYLN